MTLGNNVINGHHLTFDEALKIYQDESIDT